MFGQVTEQGPVDMPNTEVSRSLWTIQLIFQPFDNMILTIFVFEKDNVRNSIF